MKGNFKLVLSLVFVLAVQLSLALNVSDAQTCPAPNPDSRFITGPEFLNNSSMTLQDIRDFLRRPNINSWLQGDAEGDGKVFDVDPVNPPRIDFAQLVLDAAADPIKDPKISPRPINPQLLLAMVQRENRMLVRPKRPNNKVIATIMNCPVTPTTLREQVQCAARTLRNRFDELAACRTDTTWRVDITRITDDGVNVRPRNAATGTQFAYDPEAGIQWGGDNKDVGGNAAYCLIWYGSRYGFARPPTTLTLAPANPTLACSDPFGPPDRRNVTFSVSGGTPPYTWSVATNITPTNATIPASGCGQLGEDAVLKPPENPGATVSGVAYARLVHRIDGDGHGFGCQHSCRPASTRFKCDDSITTAPAPSCGVLASDPLTYGGTHLGDHVGHRVDCGPENYCPSTVPSGLQTFVNDTTTNIGRVCDARTPSMIEQRCRPCIVEMQGATVTVKDANPDQAPVTTTITVQ